MPAGGSAMIVLPPPDCDQLLLTEPHPIPSMAEQAEVVERVAILERTLWMELHPLPHWCKLVLPGPRFVMLRVNSAYERATGMTAEEYAGRPDSEVWDGFSAQNFEATDREVLEKRTACPGLDKATMRDGEVVCWRNVKWPMFARSGDAEDQIIAICCLGERE